MGKSPGRWIKTVLFGKKNSKSRSSKNFTPDKKVSIRTTKEDHIENSPDISATHELVENGATYVRPENGIPDTTSFGSNQGQELQVVSVSLSNDEILRQNQSAAKAQAAFRGYLARRAFRALKGIIRLQALIRGHLVRRQAVATLYSMQAIVKLQTAIRGWNAGFSSSSEKRPWKHNGGGLQVMNYESVATNSYIHKLLRSVPTAMPLALQCEEAEPNSASVWLDRWSHSRFWVPLHPRKIPIKSHRMHALQNDSVKSKRTSRKADNAQNGDNGVSASDETDAKRNLKKGTSHQADLVQKQPQNELEKVKRSLRKAPVSVAPVSENVETVIEKPEPQLSVKTGSEPEEPSIDADETMNPITTDNNGFEAAPNDEAFEVTQNELSPVAANPLENGTELKNEEMGLKDNQKLRERRSLPAKSEFNESPSPNTPPPSLPSYMSVTQSAKAKLRASGSPKVVDGGNHIRRHSLPSANSKSASISPGVQAPSSKGAVKTNKSTASIRDGWKR